MHVGQLDGYAEATQTGDGPSPRLVRAAHEFEGQMMMELLKPLTNSDGLTGAEKDMDSGAGAGEALGQFASEALGQALSARGGFGIADGIVKELSHAGNQDRSRKVTANPPGDTVMRRHE